ncbi:MAG: dienelactone hydrolase family protein [Pirellulaceae bacterium]
MRSFGAQSWSPARWLGWLLTLGVMLTIGSQSRAAVVTAKSGMQFDGNVDRIGSLNENPLNPSRPGGEVTVRPIVIIDDNLRRIFMAFSQVASTAESPPVVMERIKIDQRVQDAGRRISSVGPLLKVTPFDAWGRRIFSMQGPRGPLNIIQGITEVTPTYTRVRALLVKNGYVWDMRLNTHSIPRATLSQILTHYIDRRDSDARLRIVQLYIQARRYRDALIELEKVMRDFPDLEHLNDQADTLLQHLARQALREIAFRRDAGQHQRVSALLANFPKEGVAGEILLQVRDMLGEYETQKQQYERALELLKTQIAEIEDGGTRDALVPIHEEIQNDLGVHTLNRMADYSRLADDTSMTPDQKVALAVSGWLLGSGAATDNLAVAISLVDVRDAVVSYLQSMHHHERQAILEKIKGLEGGTPSYVAKILENIRPPLAIPEPQTESEEKKPAPGFFEFTIPGLEEEAKFTYYLQLPPEYHPDRRYPCVVTLNGAGSSELKQIDWWAGGFNERSQMRDGQAARRGYIVLAPQWREPYQSEYGFTAREHAAVLHSLRHAIRRFSIDTNRVFLSGHSMGGDAAWDIGVAHPDLWAGVIPIVARANKYIHRYTVNARGLPLYFVGGELDNNWLRDDENAREFDRYVRRANYDCTIVEYRGRGHEFFEDEVQRIFDWMGLRSHERDFFPSDIGRPSFREGVATMRPWDDFFWWIELGAIPPRSIVYPAEWPPDRGTRPIETFGQVLGNNRVSVTARCGQVTVWLSPRMIDFDRPSGVTVNGDAIRAKIAPDLELLLEDVRTRGDRQNPFWSKVEWPERRR